MPTSTVVLSLEVDDQDDLQGFFIDLPAADAMPEKADKPYYSTKGSKPDWQELFSSDLNSVPPKVRSWGDSVGMLTSFTGSSVDGYKTWCCSGVVIATEPKTLFLTNFHCGGPKEWGESLWSDDICSNTIVDMSWDNDAVSMEYVCKHVVKVDPQLDAAVLEIVPKMLGASAAKPVRVRTSPVGADETLLMIHHPQCLPKQISQGCMAGQALPNWKNSALTTDFSHRCDSEGGSSGAPLFDKEGHLVGLHHLGYAEASPDKCDNVNKAVSIPSLLEFLDSLPILRAP